MYPCLLAKFHFLMFLTLFEWGGRMHYQCRILLPQKSYFKANFKNPYLTIILRTNPKHNFKGERTYTFFP